MEQVNYSWQNGKLCQWIFEFSRRSSQPLFVRILRLITDQHAEGQMVLYVYPCVQNLVNGIGKVRASRARMVANTGWICSVGRKGKQKRCRVNLYIFASFMYATAKPKSWTLHRIALLRWKWQPRILTSVVWFGFVVRGESPVCRLISTASMLEWLRNSSPTTHRGAVRKGGAKIPWGWSMPECFTSSGGF